MGLAGLAFVMIGSAPGCRDKTKVSTAVETDKPLAVFLHGVFEGKGDPNDDHVRERLRAAGFAVWTPTGKPGLCDWSEDAKRSTCWPSDERTLGKAREIVREWQPNLPPSQPMVVVGFSNGGAFATLLATHRLVPACGFASLHGFPAGAIHAEAGQGKRAPILLVGGRGAAWESAQMSATSAQLKTLGWPHETKTHDGGHVVSDQDLDAAIAFARDAVRGCTTHDAAAN
jgi:dienelactone hydrolase